MTYFKRTLSLILLMICLSAESQSSGSRITVTMPDIQMEATSIWRTINDIDFLESQGYRINLPDSPIIDSLIVKSKNKAFGNDDFSTIYELLENGIFKPSDYSKAESKVQAQSALLNQMIDQIAIESEDWDFDFKLFDEYKIVFTLYGTGGSYDPDEGTVTLLTNPSGQFTRYKNPANTIIHEIVHMGVEYSLVRKYELAHVLKESLVDHVVVLMFKDRLPEYRIQKMGAEGIEAHLFKKEQLASLDQIVSGIQK